MTKEEAIARLQADLGWHHSDGNRKAHEMGIQALERTKWIPCSERLPEGLVICCDKEGNMLLGYLRRSATGYIAHDYAGTELYGCVAWLPLPDAYCKENEKMKYSERLKPCPFCGGKGEMYQAPTMLNLKMMMMYIGCNVGIALVEPEILTQNRSNKCMEQEDGQWEE